MGYRLVGMELDAAMIAGMALIVLGLVSFGFQLWIPSNLHELGFTEVTASRILRDSALIGLPLNFVIAWLYGFWSSKKDDRPCLRDSPLWRCWGSRSPATG